MEILKFDEAPKPPNRARSSRKSKLMPLAAFGIAVLVLGGLSTTLAATINLNAGGSAEFGQGVITTAACDTSISVTPVSSYVDTDTVFSVSGIKVWNIGALAGTNGDGCLGKTLTFRAYDHQRGELNITTNNLKTLTIKIRTPANNTFVSGTHFEINSETGISVTATGFTDSLATTQRDDGATFPSSATTGALSISGLNISKNVTRITIESS